MKATTACLLLLFAVPGPAMAQDRQTAPDNRLLRDPYTTATGSTVDKPGEPQGSAPTPLDRSINRDDNKIDSSLCKGC